MAAPKITQLPTPPTRSDAPSDFTAKADAFVAALPKFGTEANAQADWLNTQFSGIEQSVAQASNSASAAKTSETNAAKSAQDAVDNAAAQIKQAVDARDAAQTYATNAKASADAAEAAGGGSVAMLHAVAISF